MRAGPLGGARPEPGLGERTVIARVVSNDLPAALGRNWDLRDMFEEVLADLSDEHPAASYGLPVLIADGLAYGPGDLPGVTLTLINPSPGQVEWARGAGWAVATPRRFCAWCGDDRPELPRMATTHPECAAMRAQVAS